MTGVRVLICDDEEESLALFSRMLGNEGMAVECFASGEKLIQRLRDGGDAALLLLDVRMPEVSGLQLLEQLRQLRPELQIIMMTAFGTIDDAVKAIRLGAYDFITKPCPRAKLLVSIRHALENDFLRRENRELRSQRKSPDAAGAIVFRSERFREIHDLALKVAGSSANIVILGESGTGKELIARVIHRQSPRSNRPFLSINCAAFSESLLESQLFGHLRGAFTGAVASHKGFLEEADGGTLFLDEIADMAPAIQAKVLRAIQEGEFFPVGAGNSRRVDVRFVAATNRELEREVAAGRFREDLFFRLSVITLKLPPLRERRDDIEPLTDYYLALFNSQMKKRVTGISTEARRLLIAYSWPGNVRELRNIMERAIILAEGCEITPESLPLTLSDGVSGPRAVVGSLESSLEQLEREHIACILEATGGHKSHSAAILGVCRRTLDRKMEAYGLGEPAPRGRPPNQKRQGE